MGLLENLGEVVDALLALLAGLGINISLF